MTRRLKTRIQTSLLGIATLCGIAVYAALVWSQASVLISVTCSNIQAYVQGLF